MKNSILLLILLSFTACATYEKDSDAISWKKSERCDGLRTEFANLELYLMNLANKGNDYTVNCMVKKDSSSIKKYKKELEKFREFQGTDAMTSWGYNLHHCTETRHDSSQAFAKLYTRGSGDVLENIYKMYYTCSGKEPASKEDILAGKFPPELEEMARFQSKRIMFYK